MCATDMADDSLNGCGSLARCHRDAVGLLYVFMTSASYLTLMQRKGNINEVKRLIHVFVNKTF